MNAKEIMDKEDLNFVLVSDKGTLKSRARGIMPIYENIKDKKDYFEGASVSDRVIGSAAAILLVYGGIKDLYTDLISDKAVKILEEAGVSLAYSSKVAAILNKDKSGPCPMESLAKDLPSAQVLIERIGDFFENK